MRLGTLVRSTLIFVPLLLVCAARLHAQKTTSPEMTQEVNRCLTVMRVAASRRKTSRERLDRERLVASASTDASRAWDSRSEQAQTA